ncbi:MAG: MmcQ/YjbR family DNA-binding protein [Pseudomonadales bacterium]
MKRTILDAVQSLCAPFPDTEQIESHGSPTFKVRGKSFAIYSLNHHGDGRVALWLAAPRGSQNHYSDMQPECYFVPPYVGAKGWLGVELNKGLAWQAVCERVFEAYCAVAPEQLGNVLTGPPDVEPPVEKMLAEDINPFLRPSVKKALQKLALLCEALPETTRTEQFGNPAWKAGRKTFVSANYYDKRLALQFWVGLDKQSLLTLDSRFSVPAYTGNNGWINLDIHKQRDWVEIEALLLESYRHFALKRMMKLLPQ